MNNTGVKTSMNPIKNVENINTLSSHPVCDVDNIPLKMGSRWCYYVEQNFRCLR